MKYKYLFILLFLSFFNHSLLTAETDTAHDPLPEESQETDASEKSKNNRDEDDVLEQGLRDTHKNIAELVHSQSQYPWPYIVSYVVGIACIVGGAIVEVSAKKNPISLAFSGVGILDIIITGICHYKNNQRKKVSLEKSFENEKWYIQAIAMRDQKKSEHT